MIFNYYRPWARLRDLHAPASVGRRLVISRILTNVCVFRTPLRESISITIISPYPISAFRFCQNKLAGKDGLSEYRAAGVCADNISVRSDLGGQCA